MRNKWKRAYDLKVENILGMPAQTAMAKLERMVLLHLARKLNLDICHQCEQLIEDPETLSIEHINPWGGNKAKGLEPNVENFWNMENLKLSHKRCNSAAGQGGTGKYKYIGVHDHRDPRRKLGREDTVRGMISINGKNKTLGTYPLGNEIKAAIAYDIGLMAAFNGIGKLNFKNLRND